MQIVSSRPTITASTIVPSLEFITTETEAPASASAAAVEKVAEAAETETESQEPEETLLLPKANDSGTDVLTANSPTIVKSESASLLQLSHKSFHQSTPHPNSVDSKKEQLLDSVEIPEKAAAAAETEDELALGEALLDFSASAFAPSKLNIHEIPEKSTTNINTAPEEQQQKEKNEHEEMLNEEDEQKIAQIKQEQENDEKEETLPEKESTKFIIKESIISADSSTKEIPLFPKPVTHFLQPNPPPSVNVPIFPPPAFPELLRQQQPNFPPPFYHKYGGQENSGSQFYPGPFSILDEFHRHHFFTI